MTRNAISFSATTFQRQSWLVMLFMIESAFSRSIGTKYTLT